MDTRGEVRTTVFSGSKSFRRLLEERSCSQVPSVFLLTGELLEGLRAADCAGILEVKCAELWGVVVGSEGWAAGKQNMHERLSGLLQSHPILSNSETTTLLHLFNLCSVCTAPLAPVTLSALRIRHTPAPSPSNLSLSLPPSSLFLCLSFVQAHFT